MRHEKLLYKKRKFTHRQKDYLLAIIFEQNYQIESLNNRVLELHKETVRLQKEYDKAITEAALAVMKFKDQQRTRQN